MIMNVTSTHERHVIMLQQVSLSCVSFGRVNRPDAQRSIPCLVAADNGAGRHGR